MFWYYDPTYWMVLIGALIALYAQFRVSAAYSKWSRVPSSTHMTGAQIARQILDGNGCQNVRIEAINGKLTDHYDPENGVLRLSSEVYGSTSIAALGVAAHEAGHAIQDAQNYAPLRIRSTLVPIANIGSGAAIPLFMLGLIFSWQPLVEIGILCFALAGAVLCGDAAGGIQRIRTCGCRAFRKLSAGGRGQGREGGAFRRRADVCRRRASGAFAAAASDSSFEQQSPQGLMNQPAA